MARIDARNLGRRLKNVLRQYGFEVRGTDVLRPVKSQSINLTLPVLWKDSVRHSKTLDDAHAVIGNLLRAFNHAGIPGKYVTKIKTVSGDARIKRRSRPEIKAWNFICNVSGSAIPKQGMDAPLSSCN